MAEIDDFMAAIRSVESGGNYQAVGPRTKYGFATGAYQFLDSTWGGHGGFKSAKDAPSSVQDERARQLMSTYFNQFGRWDLVAVAWHGGPGAAAKAAKDPNYSATIGDGYNTTDKYTSKVMQRFGGGDGYTGTAVAGEELSVEELVADRYPAWAYLLDDEELGPLLKEAADKNWSSQVFTAKLEATDWWKGHGASQRKWDALAHRDPEEAKREVQKMGGQLRDMALTLGVEWDANLEYELSINALYNGLDQNEIQDMLVARLTFDPDAPDLPGGRAGDTITQVRELADEYMLTLSDEEAFGYMNRMARGELDDGGLEQLFRELASQRMPQLAEWIEKGVSPGAYFQPYKNEIAAQTGQNPLDIDFLNDSTWNQILSTAGDDGMPRPMTFPEMQKFVRGTSQYQNGRRGQAEAADLVSGLTRSFGVR